MFSPVTDLDTISANLSTIKSVLEDITNIEAAAWQIYEYYTPYSYQDYATGMNYNYVPFQISITNRTNNTIKNKLRALKQWLDHDHEEFIQVFNSNPNISSSTQKPMFIAKVEDYYLQDYGQLDEGKILEQSYELLHISKKGTELPGHGLLYAKDTDSGTPNKQLLFCNYQWGWAETQVACRTMGYDFGIYLEGATDEVDGNFANWEIYYTANCNGDEPNIWNCTITENMQINDPSGGDCDYDDFDKGVSVYCIRHC